MRIHIVVAALLAAAACAPIAQAQSYPAKPVRILVGFAPGGGTDIMARAVAAKLTEFTRQQFIVENRPGANANLAARIAAEAPADGYTILFMSVAHIIVKLNQEMVKALAVPEVRKRLAGLGAEIVASSPEDTAAFFRTELAKYSKVAKAANIRTD